VTPLNPISRVDAYSGGGHAGLGESQSRRAALIEALAEIAPDRAIEVLSASGTDMARLLLTLDHPPSIETSVQLAELYRAAVSAANDGNAQLALTQLAKFAAIDPRRGEGLPSDPAFATIHSEVSHLLSKLAFVAKANADARLDQARQFLQTADIKESAINPKVALLAASQLLDAGGLANLIHSTELSQLVLDYARWVPAPTEVGQQPAPGARMQVTTFLWLLLALGALLLIVYSVWR
jgi:hypothetical protein